MSTHECGHCGKEFDSEKGLKVHTTQMHDGEDPVEKETVKQASVGNVTFRLNLYHALLIVFAVGIMTGGFFSLMAVQLSGATGLLAAGENVDNQDNTDNGAGATEPVALETTEFPYDTEMNTGSGDISWETGTVSMTDRPYLGNADADITIATYEDFFCGFCGRHNQETVPQLMENYVETGEAQYVYKHFPAVGGVKPAVAAECALNQDQQTFWTFKHALFENQDALMNLAQNDEAVLDETMKNWADTLGLDTEQFNQCYDNQETQDRLNTGMQEARNFEATGTPTVMINGKKIVGACPFDTFEQAIQAEKNGEDWEVVQCNLVQQ